MFWALSHGTLSRIHSRAIITKSFFVFGALLLCALICLVQVPTQLFDAENSVNCSTVQYLQCSNAVVSYSIVAFSKVQ